MSAGSRGRGGATWALAALLGCAGGVGPSPGPDAPPARSDIGTWSRLVSPFPVTDSAGVPLDLAFLGGLDAPRVRFADVDGDGDADLLLQERPDEVMLLENTGGSPAPRFVWRTDRFAGVEVGEWFRPLDGDGDGDVDLFAEHPFNHLRYYRNDAGVGAGPRYVVATDSVALEDGTALFSDRQNIPSILDFDCNGRLDLFVGRIDGTVSRFEAVAPMGERAPAFRLVAERFENIQVVAQLVPSARHGANAMTFGDVDGDGDIDLLWGDFFEPGLLLFENVGTCRQPRLRSEPVAFPAADPVATSGYNAGELADVDADGNADLVIGVIGGAYDPNRTAIENTYLLERGSGGWRLVTRRLLRAIDAGSESVPALGDLDGDGDLDLLVGSKIEGSDATTASLRFLENVGSATAPAFRERGRLPIRGGFQYAPALGDLDGDGDADLLLGTWNRGVSYWRNDGPGPDGLPAFSVVDSSYIVLTRGSHAAPALGDVDGDGDLDLFVGESSGEVNAYRNVGDRVSPAFELVDDTWGGIDVGRRSVPAVATLAGATRLLLGAEDGGLRAVALGAGALAGAAESADPLAVADAGIPLPANSAPTFGDLDGDGAPELIAGNRSGGLLFYTTRAR
ncbi:MAG TPA: FG-GAP-like repeat-containing protein [Longimicrobiales bacterium]|nr:FG-GAP-like repeat-containing protein [Longimicrobiales bacterium]